MTQTKQDKASITPQLLTEAEFKATSFDAKPRKTGEPEVEFWPYFDQIPKADLQGYDCSDENILAVYRMGDYMYEHVLIATNERLVSLVIVIDLQEKKVHGHYLLKVPAKA